VARGISSLFEFDLCTLTQRHGRSLARDGVALNTTRGEYRRASCRALSRSTRRIADLEILFQPPYWVHAALWLPLILIVALGPLRPMKGLMIAVQHYHKAGERRFGGAP
jgi:hypothetical protein